MSNGTVTPAASAGLSADGAATLVGGGALATQPDSLAGAEVTPSETVTVQSGGAEKKLLSSLNAPFPSAVVDRAPGVPVTIRFATAPLPSMRTVVPCSSARLIEIAAWAGAAAASTPRATATAARQRAVRIFAPIRERRMEPVSACTPSCYSPGGRMVVMGDTGA